MEELGTAYGIQEAFDQDYLYFYEGYLSPERTEHDVLTILRLLDPPPGMRVLDMACGHGRIANRLARRGLDVTGVDITPLFLEIARREAQTQGLTARYVRADMRALPMTEQFDAALSWFTAFGYFDDDGNRRTLREVCRALKPGGVFLLDLNNRDFVLTWFRSQSVASRDGDFMFDFTGYDPLTARFNTERIIVRDGTRRRIHYFIRTFAYTELRDWLLQAGFSQVEGFGDGGSPFTRTSRRMIVRAWK
jgi:SAM-dependent methyltransferase